eukprot:12607879-Heterocapsa_arctica.AAC.1
MIGRPVGRTTGLRRSGRRPPGSGRSGSGSRRPGSAGPPKSVFGVFCWASEGIMTRATSGGTGKPPGKLG